MLQIAVTNLPEIRAKLSAMKLRAIKELRDLIFEVSERALAKTKELTPVDTGQTREKWFIRSFNRKGPSGKAQGAFFVAVTHPYNRVGTKRTVTNDFGEQVRQTVNDGKFNLLEALEYGTGPHVITPKAVALGSRSGASSNRDKFLRFKIGGKTIYTQQVHHPGTRAYNMTTIAAAEAQRDVNAKIAMIAERLTRDLKGLK
jgi:hypothetical protein